MPGKAHSPFAHQRRPYVIQKKDTGFIDKFGNVHKSDAPEIHIPIDEFNLIIGG